MKFYRDFPPMTRQQPQALFFDFDGVLVDSNRIKTEAFYELFRNYDKKILARLISYHQQHGGISRVVKIKYAFDEIIKKPLNNSEITQLATTYSNLVMDKVVNAPWINGAETFLNQTRTTLPIFLISGTPQEELQLIIQRRNMSHFFSEILGSPVEKPQHIQWLLSKYSLSSEQCVFIGDAHTDYQAALSCNMPFIGIQGDYTFDDKVVVLPDCTYLESTIINVFSGKSL